MDYVIGDVHGCYQPLMRLLDKIKFDENVDSLWFCGDFVNRGPDALSVLRFVSTLKVQPCVVLGNHDLHFLAVYYGVKKKHPHFDAFDELIDAPDVANLVNWLQCQRLAIYNKSLNVLLTHAGICPNWSLQQTLDCAKEVELALQNPNQIKTYLLEMYGNEPSLWCDDIKGHERLRLITNYLTRMRYLDKQSHHLLLQHKTLTDDETASPWFDFVEPRRFGCDLMFGHWAALDGRVSKPGIFGLDTGCYFGGSLTAMCIQTKQKYQVPGIRKLSKTIPLNK